MIRGLLPSDFDAILNVINDAAQSYRGVIPDDRWKEPYMSAEELKEEIKKLKEKKVGRPPKTTTE